MTDESTPVNQQHPLYAEDRANLDKLLTYEAPTDANLVDLARLLIRYDGFPGASDLQKDMVRTMRLWKLNREELNHRARRLWSAGFRAGNVLTNTVGSGFDTSDSDST